MSKEKRNFIMSLVALGISVLLLIGTTIAYFADTKQITNTITVGNVEIEMTEAAVRNDELGNLVADTSASRIIGGFNTVHNYGKLYPGMSVYKDPTIENVGDTDAWVAACITVKDGAGDIHRVIGYDVSEGIDIRMLISGGLLDEAAHFGVWNGIPDVRYNDHYAIVQKASVVDGEYKFYIFLQEPLKKDDKVVLFDNLYIPAEWQNGEMQEFREFSITVEAYAVQTFDLESSLDAMTKAFSDKFSF